MSDKKITDEEIIKRLEKCVKRGNRNYNTDIVLDLIDRQKAEIERLNEIIKNCHKEILQKCDSCNNRIKTEAYKEFAERLKKETLSDRGYDILQQGTIDNFLKEMVGEEK